MTNTDLTSDSNLPYVPVLPTPRSQRRPRQYLSLERHKQNPPQVLSEADILWKYNRQPLITDLIVKLPKPRYVEATARRRQDLFRTTGKTIAYTIAPKAPRAGKGVGTKTTRGGNFKETHESIFIPKSSAGLVRPIYTAGFRKKEDALGL